jgi:hypothetical protein
VVLGQAGGNHGGPDGCGQLDGDGADPAVGPDHQHGVALAEAEGVVDGQGGDRGQGGRPGLGEVDPVGQVGHLVLGDGDQLGPAAVVDPWAHSGTNPNTASPGT